MDSFNFVARRAIILKLYNFFFKSSTSITTIFRCDYQTAYSGTFREHQKVAHGTQKYECKMCNHVARYKGNLDKHIRNVHQKQTLKII